MPELLRSFLHFMSRLLNGLGRLLRAYFISVGLFVTLAPMVIIVFSHYISRHAGMLDQKISDKSKLDSFMVQLTLDGNLTEREDSLSSSFLEHFFKTQDDFYVPDMRAVFRHLAEDERVKGVQISLRSLQGSFAEFSELRRVFATFKESKKPLYFYLEEADDDALYLASVADHIGIAPTSEIMTPGPTFNLTYFGSALKKLGVEIEVMRAGKYKSAFEPFVANKPSPETLEEYRSLNRSMLDHLVESIAQGRNKSPQQVRGWFHQTIYSPTMAKEAGIVDAIAYFPAEADVAQNAMGAKDRIDYEDYEEDYAQELAKKEKGHHSGAGVGLIEAIGEIHMSASDAGRQDGIDPETMKKQVDWALQEEDVKSVVLRVSSPGGSALASDLILQDLQRLAEKKPIIVSMGAYAASGGYWISMAGKRIFAEPLTITGSIGVISMRPSFAPFEEKYGVSFHTVTESDRVGLISPGGRSTPTDRSLLNQSIDEVYQLFLRTVSAGRKIPVQKVGELAQGRVYTGKEALGFGLVDEMGGVYEAFRSAKELGGLDVNKLYPVLRYQEGPISLKACLKNSSMMMKCFQQFGAQTEGARVLVRLKRAFSGVSDMPLGVAGKIQPWLERFSDARSYGRFLALWPGILNAAQ